MHEITLRAATWRKLIEATGLSVGIDADDPNFPGLRVAPADAWHSLDGKCVSALAGMSDRGDYTLIVTDEEARALRAITEVMCQDEEAEEAHGFTEAMWAETMAQFDRAGAPSGMEGP